jgi:hypothetical protein
MLLPLASWCQDPESLKTGRISIGLVFSPDYCYRTLSSGESDEWIVNIRNKSEIHKFGYTTGFSFVYKPVGRISLETGLLYSDKGERTKPETLIAANPDQLLPKQIEFIYSYNYIDIPFKINYLFLDKKFKLYVTAGLSTNIFLFQNTICIQEFEDGAIKKISSRNESSSFYKINLAFLTGFAAEYEISNRLKLHLEPLYRRSITPIMDSSVKGYLFSTGINTGIYYKL